MKNKLVKCKYCANYKKLEDWCYQIEDSPYEDIERECKHFIKRLVLQEIREMKAEDLASAFIRIRHEENGDMMYESVDKYVFENYSDAHTHMMKLLYSPVEDRV